jgi:hypothetical protein
MRIGIQPKMLDPNPYHMKTGPKPWRKVAKSTIDGVDAVTTWTHIFFAGENTPAAVKVQRDETETEKDDLEKCQYYISRFEISLLQLNLF